MTAPTWTLLPDTGALVLFAIDGVPLLLLSRDGDHCAIELELEARHGWRVQTTTLTNHDAARGWLRLVEFAGRVAVPFSYDTLKCLPSEWRDLPQRAELQRLTGLVALSATHQLREPWGEHPRGTYLVWCSGQPGALGAVYVVGAPRVLAALVPSIGELLEVPAEDPVPHDAEIAAKLSAYRADLCREMALSDEQGEFGWVGGLAYAIKELDEVLRG